MVSKTVYKLKKDSIECYPKIFSRKNYRAKVPLRAA